MGAGGGPEEGGAAPALVVRLREHDGSPAVGVPLRVEPAAPGGLPVSDEGGTVGRGDEGAVSRPADDPALATAEGRVEGAAAREQGEVEVALLPDPADGSRWTLSGQLLARGAEDPLPGYVIFVLLSGVPKHLSTGKGDAITKLFAGFALWVRDDIVFPVMGREGGQKFLPYFMMVFFFVMFMNVLGLVPGSATATASIFVTAALAGITFGSMVICGMVVQGPVAFWINWTGI